MKQVTIYGERCSGTNYLEELLLLNFNVEINWDYGWKHFFGFNDLSDSEHVLFIGIVRNLEDWLNSFYREKHHLPNDLTENIDTFLNNTFYSIDYNKNEVMNDRNIDTLERYKNIFELRLVKNKYLIEKMPLLVKNYILITHDELIHNFVEIMNTLHKCGLEIKDDTTFPTNITYFKKNKEKIFTKKPNIIPKDKIVKVKFELLDSFDEKFDSYLKIEKILFQNFNLISCNFLIYNMKKINDFY